MISVPFFSKNFLQKILGLETEIVPDTVSVDITTTGHSVIVDDQYIELCSGGDRSREDHIVLYEAYIHTRSIVKDHVRQLVWKSWLTHCANPRKELTIKSHRSCDVFPRIGMFVIGHMFFTIEPCADMDVLLKWAAKYRYYTSRMNYHFNAAQLYRGYTTQEQN